MTVSHRILIRGLVASGAAISIFSLVLARTGKWYLDTPYAVF